MGLIYSFLATYEPLVYIALAIMGLYAFRWMWRSWREWRASVYSLEREFSLNGLRKAAAFGFAVLLLFFGEFYVSTFIAPSLPASDLKVTPTLDLLAEPAVTVSPNDTVAVATPEVQSGMSGCVPDQIMLTAPGPGEEISGTVTLTGTADISNFGFYKYEFAQLGTSNWTTISAGDQVVDGNELGKWDTASIASGDYFLRLVVLDNVGQTLEPCVIAVRITNQ